MYQSIQIIGYLGADPEMRYLANGTAVTNFSVATSRRWKDASGEQREETEWFRVQAWAKLAEVCAQYLQKGRLVFVGGRMQTRSYEKDGQKRYATDLVAQEVKFLGGRDGGGGGSGMGNGEGWGAAGAGGDIDPDDLPFAADPTLAGWQDEHAERVS